MATEEMTGRDPPPIAGPPAIGPPAGARISRFIVLGPLGAGGMGVVVAAYDATLDRKVAIKLLRPEIADEQVEVRTARLLREAQAMARITHPNVVAVYEVGPFEDQVYVAMEHIDGEPLSTWLRAPRSWREITGAFLSAGRGLAAAHALGLVHRDFKPDNVLVGKDGGVRVTDFGVVGVSGAAEGGGAAARLHPGLTRAGAVVGTPGYMAPEQREGAPVDARADQFAFCVSLYSALVGHPPFAPGATEPRPIARDAAMPRWMRPLVLRGLAREPSARHPSLGSLLDALARGPRVTPRRVLVAAAVVAGLAGAVLLVGARAGVEPPCAHLDAPLAGVWDPAVAAAVGRRFAASGFPDATDATARVRAELDGYTRGWVAMRTEACLATAVRQVQSPALLDLRMRCLDRRLGALRALANLFTRADRDVVARAASAAASLEPLAGCADAEALAAAVPPPSDGARRAWVSAVDDRLDQAAALGAAGKPGERLAVLQVVAEEARATGHAPVVARALGALGAAKDDMDRPDARAALEEAVVAAGAARDDGLSVRVLAALMDRLAVGHLLPEALALRPALAAATLRAGSGAPLRVLELQSLSQLDREQGDTAAAIARLREAAALAPEDRHLAASLGFFLASEGQCAEATLVLEAALARVERSLGPDNVVAAALYNGLAAAAHCAANHERAQGYLRHLLVIAEKSYGADNPRLMTPLANLGRTLVELGRGDEALPLLQRAETLVVTAYGEDHPNLAILLDSIGDARALTGDRVAAQAAYERAFAIEERAEVAGELKAGTLDSLGLVVLAAGRADEALRILQRALAFAEGVAEPDPQNLARVEGHLAFALLALHRDGEALRHAERAWARLPASPGDLAIRGDVAWALAQALRQGRRPPGRATALALEARALLGLRHRLPAQLAAIDRWLAAD